MARIGFVGPTYQSLSPSLDAQFTMNWYLEQDESQNGRSAAALYPTPGLFPFAALPGCSIVTGLLQFQNRCFATGLVMPGTQKFFEVLGNGNVVDNNIILSPADSTLVSMVGSPVGAAGQGGAASVSIATGGIIYTVGITPTLGPLASTLNQQTYSLLEYIDGFLVSLIGGNQFQVIGPLNPSSYSALNIATLSKVADPIVSMIATDDLVVFLTNKRGLVYYNSGALFPLVPVPGVLMEQGSAALLGTCRGDNSIFWIGADERGGGIAYRNQGYTGIRISTFPVEEAWRTYANIYDATCYSYQDMGHTFVVWNFPSANATWVYDVATSSWHQRGYWANNQFNRQRGQVHAYCFGNHLIGSFASGTIWNQSTSALSDDGNAIHRVRRSPYVAREHEWVFHNQLELLSENGLPSNITGPSTSPTAYYVPDQQGNTWAVTVLDNGEFQITGPVPNSAQTIIVGDNAVAGQNWQIIVVLNAAHQNVLATIETPSQNGPLSFPIATNPGFLQSYIYVAGGQVQTQQGMAATVAPQVGLRWSDDGGHTWSNYHFASLGKTGEYLKRTIWRRLGRSRNRVYEISCSDPYPLRIIDAYLDADPEFKPQQRLSDRLRAGA